VKPRIRFFAIPVILSLLAVPLANLLGAPSREAIKWEKSFLFNMDFASRWAARLMYPLGISTNPKRVIIGRDGWLFLGDRFAQNLSINRRHASADDFSLGKKIGLATATWNIYLSSKGVKLFRIMIGPNKGTIYPEQLPDWARPAAPNALDALLAGVEPDRYIDFRPALRAAKASQPVPLYFKTDTHWNSLGGAIAFRTFAEQVAASAPDLRWPAPSAYRILELKPMAGGDLAAFLRMKNTLSEEVPVIGASLLPVTSEHVDLETKALLLRGPNVGTGMPSKPTLVNSEGSLNQRKVLWLGDSFSGGMSQLMTATFSHLLVQHVAAGLATPKHFARLVEDFKPDYVFVTVVERGSRGEAFATFPPPLVLAPPADFVAMHTTAVQGSHDLAPGAAAHAYHLRGDDPYLEFDLGAKAELSTANVLQIQLTCEDGTALVPVQLFWRRNGQAGYAPTQSVRVELTPGQSLIDLRTVAGWGTGSDIDRIRLDMDVKNRCDRFKLEAPVLGMRQLPGQR
jgi:alginate O-acetyltransferase complex protein AlgJ